MRAWFIDGSNVTNNLSPDLDPEAKVRFFLEQERKIASEILNSPYFIVFRELARLPWALYCFV